MIVYECQNIQGKIRYYLTNGHVDSIEFRKACDRMFGNMPTNINRIFMKNVTLIERNQKGVAIGSHNTNVKCSKDDKNAEKMTIGFV